MLNTDSAEKLAAIMNQFSIPMFAAQRASSKCEFKIVCINRAHSKATGLEPAAMKDVSVRAILPTKEADLLIKRYTECVRTRSPLRYLETLTLPEGVQRWDTTIQHVPLASGGDRVIGTAVQMAADAGSEGMRMTYDNIRYFSALADMQLQNLVSMFEAAQDQGLFSNGSTSRLDQLCGVCRTVQRSVEDIRETVRRADPDQTDHRDTDRGDMGQSTLRALYETAHTDG